MNLFTIKNLVATAEKKEIIKHLNLSFETDEIHVIMGPNGSGKSTLSKVIMGHPNYAIKEGTITFNKKNITNISPEEKSKQGIFLSFQTPQIIQGLSITQFLRTIYNVHNKQYLSVFEFKKLLETYTKKLSFPFPLENRYLNEGFSGGESKKLEVLQMMLIKPTIAILDEIDSGLDVDALKIVSKNILDIHKKYKTGILLITHYTRILQYIKPDKVHIMVDGRIIKSGDMILAKEIEKKGYCNVCREARAGKKSSLPIFKTKCR